MMGIDLRNNGSRGYTLYNDGEIIKDQLLKGISPAISDPLEGTIDE